MYKYSKLHFFLAAILFATAANSAAESVILAEGWTDLDGDFARENFMQDMEPDPPETPFVRSIVDVANSSGDGLWAYESSSDIGLLELKVFGEINNDGVGKSNIETGILRSSATLDDVITLESTLPGDYDVTFELDVNGDITEVSGDGRGFAAINFGPADGFDTFDSNLYNGGPVSDTLSVTRTFNGTVDADIGASLIFTVLSVDPGGIVTGALNNTATLRLIVPDGVSVGASQSGTFNTVIAPVPVPAALPLFVAGLAALGYRRRR